MLKVNLCHSLGYLVIFSYITQKTGFNISCTLSPLGTVCIECQILFTGKNKKNFKCPAENFSRVLSVKHTFQVSALLRVSTFDDHLFILNHIMRCPAGVGSWAAQLIQVPAIPSNQELVPLPFGNQYLDHLVTCLSTLLIPTR